MRLRADVEELGGVRGVVLHRAAVDAVPAGGPLPVALGELRELVVEEGEDELEPDLPEAEGADGRVLAESRVDGGWVSGGYGRCSGRASGPSCR